MCILNLPAHVRLINTSFFFILVYLHSDKIWRRNHEKTQKTKLMYREYHDMLLLGGIQANAGLISIAPHLMGVYTWIVTGTKIN